VVNVFISWSGERSRALAESIYEWLPNVIQSIDAFISTRDIHTGSRWNEVLGAHLENADLGIFCMTEDNLDSRWIHYEAGAIAKNREKSRVIPLLFNISKGQIEQPLAQFNLAVYDEAGVFGVLESLNLVSTNPLREHVLKINFDKHWPDLAAKVQQVLSEVALGQPAPYRDTKDILSELLDLTRSQEQTINRMIGNQKWTFRGNAQLDEFNEADFRQIALGLEMLKNLADQERLYEYRPADATIHTLLKLRDPLEVILARAHAPKIHGVYFVDVGGRLAMTYTEEEAERQEFLD
jgi:hypothetical protein